MKIDEDNIFCQNCESKTPREIDCYGEQMRVDHHEWARHDNYGCFIGPVCEKCWAGSYGAHYKNWVFDPMDAGESMEPI